MRLKMKFFFDKQFRYLTKSYLDQVFFKLAVEIFPSDFFIEAGAFEASASLHIRDSLPGCGVYAFEANPYNYDYFKNRLQSINYHNLAISNKQGSIDFNIMLEKKGKAVDPVKMDNSVTPRNKKGTIYKQVTVACDTIDNYFKEFKLSNVSLWIDVEGHGYELLEGCANTLNVVNIIKIEAEDKQYWKDQKLSGDIAKLLVNCGFIPLLRDYQSPLQYNILFVKENLVRSEKFTSLLPFGNIIV